MSARNIIIMGAAGRDFHNFNVLFRNNPLYRVRAFTAAQIPYISGRIYPPSLAGRLYPKGIAVFPEAELELLMEKHRIDEVVFAYSDLSHEEVMHRASIVLARGAEFRLPGPDATMLKSRKSVISVCAVRTGCGKSQVSRYICGIVREAGLKPVVVRHPMPYGDLEREVAERFAHFEDLALYKCTIEEREEYEPLISAGAVVFAGIDYREILKAAEEEGDIILWDGGNNDFPFFRPDLEITVTDPLRGGDETSYFPGEVNLRRADVVIINKVNAATGKEVLELEKSIGSINRSAALIRTASRISVSDGDEIAGKRVLVIEDGPSITHGGLPSGAGLAAAGIFRAASVVDPRPYAVGSISEIYRKYPHMGKVLPAMGYREEQIRELKETIENTPCDIVLSATPIDLNRIISLSKPLKRVFYDIEEEPGHPLRERVIKFMAGVIHPPHP
jgi:predicted GTPase